MISIMSGQKKKTRLIKSRTFIWTIKRRPRTKLSTSSRKQSKEDKTGSQNNDESQIKCIIKVHSKIQE